MKDPLSTAEMRAIETEAILCGKVTGLDLMERAGRGVVAAICDRFPQLDTQSGRAIVMCGPGNNGGDGFVVARLLKGLGWKVQVHLFGDPSGLPPDARTMHDRWAASAPVLPLICDAIRNAPAADLYVDAIFGIGLSRPVAGDLADLLRHLAGADGGGDFYRARLVAVDLPSGMNGDDGTIPGHEAAAGVPPCPFCALTVTFHRPKPAHVLGHGPDHCGKIIVADIGLDGFSNG